MRPVLKLTALLTVCCLLLCSCHSVLHDPDVEPTTQPPTDTAIRTLHAPFSASDSLNPFFCTTSVNSHLMPLIYRGLFELNDDLTARPDVAVSFSEDDRLVRAVLPTDGAFSDGSAVTASDVVYSFQKAKNAPAYSGQLQSVESAEAASPLEIVFHLSDRLPSPASLLTFPIVKNGTAESAEQSPVGTGSFVIERADDAVTLVSREEDSGTQEILLVPVTDSAKLMYTLQTGEIDFFCSDLDGERISRSGARMYASPSNTLIFMGINDASPLLQIKGLRRALSLAVNRSEIADSVYSGFAVSSVFPIRPGSRSLSGVDLPSDAVDYAEAERLLEAEGFTGGSSASAVRSSPLGSLQFSLLVCDESGYKTETASCIQNSLAAVGIAVNIRAVDYDTYVQELETGNFDLYIGEIQLPANGSLRAFFGGGASYGITAASLLSTYGETEDGVVSLSSFLTDFMDELPFVPLCFRDSVLVCSERIVVPSDAIGFADFFGGLDRWTRSPAEQGSTAPSRDDPET